MVKIVYLSSSICIHEYWIEFPNYLPLSLIKLKSSIDTKIKLLIKTNKNSFMSLSQNNLFGVPTLLSCHFKIRENEEKWSYIK